MYACVPAPRRFPSSTRREYDVTAKRFGFYSVDRVNSAAVDNEYLHAVLLDYGKGQNPTLDASRVLRDYVVQVADDVLLGIPFVALGRRRIKLPSFFVLSRFRKGLGEISPIP